MCKSVPVEFPALWRPKDADKYDNMGIEGLKPELQKSKITIDLMAIIAYYPTDDKENTIVNCGNVFELDIEYETFDKVYHDSIKAPYKSISEKGTVELSVNS